MSEQTGDVPSMYALTERYDLTMLRNLSFNLDDIGEDGALRVTAFGDPDFGNPRASVMWTFVDRWRHNVPPLKLLFTTAMTIPEECELRGSFSSEEELDEYETAADEHGVGHAAAEAYAGAFLVVVNNLLKRAQKSLNIGEEAFQAVPPLIGKQYSLGAVVQAAGDNFRHHDEWFRTKIPKPKQKPSIIVIADALDVELAVDVADHPFRNNVCPQLLKAVSGGAFEEFERRLFSFAKNMAS